MRSDGASTPVRGGVQVDSVSPIAGSTEDVVARLERLPPGWWQVRTRLILGTATFFDAVDLLAISFALPVLAVVWHLTPGESGQVLSAVFAGQIVGALAAGWAAERYGRLRVASVTVLVFALMSLACAVAWDLTSLTVFRFVQGIGLGGEVPIATAYITELARAETRGRFYILYEMVFSVGLVAAALFGVVLVPALGWQSLFVLGALPAVLAIFLRRLLPESPRWLAGQGRHAEADAAVGGIEGYYRGRGIALAAPRFLPATPVRPGNRWLAMLAPRYRRRTLAVWAMWFCCFSTTYGLLIWMPTLFRVVFKLPLQQSLLYGFIIQGAGFVGTLTCALAIDSAGRRRWFTGAFVLGGLLLCFVAYRQPASPGELLGYMCVGAALLGSVAIGLNLYTAELYPTPFRAFASSVGGAWQRVAAAAGPLVVGALLPRGLGEVFLYFGVTALTGGAITLLFAMETKQAVLEEL